MSRSTLRARLHPLFAVDLRSLAALRIALAALILADLALRYPFIAESYTDSGVWPRQAAAPTGPLFALYLVGGAPWVPKLLFAIAAAFALALGAGHWTRLATVASWLLLTSLQLRYEFFLDGGDALLRALLFWGMFAPLGARWSVDARGRPRIPGREATVTAGGVALLLQVVFLYCFAGLLKTGEPWQDGSAVELALRWKDRARPAAGLLLGFPGLLALLTPAVRWFERLGPLLLFVPVHTGRIRLLVIASFALLQLGFGLCIELQLFPWVSTSALLPFLPPGFWDGLARLLGRPAGAAEPAAAAAAPSGAAPRRWLRGSADALVAALLLYAFAANLQSVRWIRVPLALRAFGAVLGIQQAWTLFAPGPPEWNAAFEVYGQLADGSAVDLSRPDAREGWDHVRRFQRFVRFRNHLERMVRRPRPESGSRFYLDWLCRRWNADASGEQRLERIRLLVTREGLAHPPEPPRRYLLREIECRAGA